jgi:hypothetical protein
MFDRMPVTLREVKRCLRAVHIATIDPGKPTGTFMIDTLLNLLFRCSHRRLTRPVAPITRAGQPHSQSYVVCLDCGKQFEYDLNEMRIGRAIDHSHDVGVVPPNMPSAHNSKVKYALLAAVPAAVVLGAVLKGKRKATRLEESKADSTARHESGPHEG